MHTKWRNIFITHLRPWIHHGTVCWEDSLATREFSINPVLALAPDTPWTLFKVHNTLIELPSMHTKWRNIFITHLRPWIHHGTVCWEDSWGQQGSSHSILCLLLLLTRHEPCLKCTILWLNCHQCIQMKKYFYYSLTAMDAQWDCVLGG